MDIRTSLKASFVLFATSVTAASAATPADDPVSEVTVTASRIQRGGFEAPTPTTVVGAADIETQATRTVSGVLFELPAIRPAQTNPVASQNSGSTFANLRGLGTDRTLVMVDGRRFVPNSAGGGVDTNVIPAALVRRLEIVTGGASAAWGSDAVAGVVNIMLNDELQGFSGDVQYGQSQRADDKETSASFAFGTAFGAERGNFVIGADTFRNTGILTQAARDWSSQHWVLFSNPAAATNGLPARLITTNARLSRATYGGVIIAPASSTTTPTTTITAAQRAALANIQFGPGGTRQAFAAGSIVGTLYQLGGDGINISDQGNLDAPRQRQSVFAKTKYDITDNINAFVELSYAKSESEYDIVETTDNGSSTVTIRNDNPYLPAFLRTLMTTNNIASFTMGRVHGELGSELNSVSNTVARGAAGFNGKLGENWTWDAYYQYGRNRYDAQLGVHRIESRWQAATDVITSTATGQPVCRVNGDTNPANDISGCVPINLFGPDTISPAGAAWVVGTQKYLVYSTQSVAAASVQGDLFSLWAGPLTVATGLEYRKENMDGNSDPISQANGFRYGNPKPFVGDFDVKEGFIEAVLPLAKEAPLAQLIDLNGAVRFTDYSYSGSVTTWKVGMNWQPFDDLRFRATRSHDIRAPNIQELYGTGNAILVTVTDPVTLQDSRITSVTGGNPFLFPETGDTTTAGVVYQPSWATGLKVSLDKYDIKLTDAITAIGAAGAIDRCYRGQSQFCDVIVRDPASGLITSVNGGQFNLSRVNTDGYDLEIAYSLPLSKVFEPIPGSLTTRLLVTKINEYTSVSDGAPVRTDGSNNGGLPTWQANLQTAWNNGPLNISARARVISSGTFSNSFGPADISNNHIGSMTYLYLSGSYKLPSSELFDVQLFAKVDNVLDKDPPITPDAGVQPLASNSPFYDRIGRSFAIGMRFKF